MINIYTDGGCRKTGTEKGQSVLPTDKAAWAFMIQDNALEIKKSEGQPGKTNNYMELTAVIEALETLISLNKQDEPVTLFADSQYVLNGLTIWKENWKANDWRNAKKKTIANKELWVQLDELINQFPKIEYVWVKGHDSNQGNLIVDELLNKTMDNL